jgi:haloalkane dehalogenase
MITRHFVDVGSRRVHYRRAGSGPPLLMVHQSPRSSAEYEALITAWAPHFTIIAPDTPGFGQSDPLPGLDRPEVEDYADAVVALLDALGIAQTGAYGFHSGAIILITAAKRHPHRFAAVAANGYAVWLPEERAIFGERYTPAFRPSPYGEHLTWAWNRILEQSWFFPWYDVRPGARLSVAHDDPRLVHETVMDLLAAGDAYRLGYSAVLRANRDVPGPDQPTPPVLITAAEPDPLHAHLDRLGPLPPNWTKQSGPTRAATDALCLDHLRAHPAPLLADDLPQAPDAGFVAVELPGFAGLIHWRGNPQGTRLLLPAPGSSAAAQMLDPDTLTIDLPGHGVSDDWDAGTAPSIDGWAGVAAAAARAIGLPLQIVAGEGWSALLAIAVATRLGLSTAQAVAGLLPLPDQATAWAEAELPDPGPDRHGAHLTRAWGMVRARQFFWPWFRAGQANAIPFAPDAVDPARLAALHLAAMQAVGGRRLIGALAGVDRARLLQDAEIAGLEVRWPLPDWAAARSDVWRPNASTV